jgi:YVTN family beta-propeller protein
MSAQSSSPLRAGRRSWRLALSVALVAMLAAATIGPASAATVTTTWNAKVGSSGANGTARIQAFTSGTGALTLKLIKLRASSTLPVVISKGTCKAVGATVATLPSIRTNSAGASTRTLTLTSAQMKVIKAATKGTGKIIVRVGTGSTRKCGAFALAVPPVVEPKVAATIPVGIAPSQVAIDASGVWVTNWYDNTLSRIDPGTNTVLSVNTYGLATNSAPEAIATGFGSLWFTIVAFDDQGMPNLPGAVIRVDPSTGSAIGSPIPVGRGPITIASSAEAVWVSNAFDGTVTRIDPVTNQVAATITVGGNPVGLVAGFGSVWVANYADGKIARIDPLTNQVTATVQTQLGGTGLAVGAGSVWVTFCGCGQTSGVVSRIDPSTNSVVAVVPVGLQAEFAAFGGGYLWVTIDADNTVIQIDPATNLVRRTIPVGAPSYGIAASDHAVWVVHPVAAGADPSVPLPGSVTRINF